MNLACTRRYPGVPMLSTIWEIQGSLWIILEVFPGETLDYQYLEHVRCVACIFCWKNRAVQFRIVGDPSPEAWNRIWRCASWTRQVSADECSALGEGTPPYNTSTHPMVNGFQRYKIHLGASRNPTPPYADLFFSPHSKNTTRASWS